MGQGKEKTPEKNGGRETSEEGRTALWSAKEKKPPSEVKRRSEQDKDP